MTSYSIRAALLASVLAVSSCGDLLNAGFENDLPGRSPSIVLPGQPVGDRLTPGPSKSFFVTSEDGLIGHQAYAFVEGEAQRDARLATSFKSAPVNDIEAPVYISWRGKFGNGGGMTVLAGYEGQPYVQIKFAKGDIHVEGKSIGTYHPGDNHNVVVSLFPKEKAYRVEIKGDLQGVQAVTGRSRSVDSVGAGVLASAEFSIDKSGQERLVYVIDDVKMSHNAPG